ncbi:MAG: VOC family protein [Kiritimatiellia bacterium]
MSEITTNEMTQDMNTIVQIGIVMPNMDDVKQGMREMFGLEPDSEGVNVYKDVMYRGQKQDAPAKVAFYNFFNVQLEFLVPFGDEDTVWSDYLNLGQYGLHHIRFDVEDNDALTEKFAKRGIERWMEGDSLVTPGKKFTYYDTLSKLGFVIEAVTK